MRYHYVITTQHNVGTRRRNQVTTRNGYVESPDDWDDRQIFDDLLQQICREIGSKYGLTTVLFYRLTPAPGFTVEC